MEGQMSVYSEFPDGEYERRYRALISAAKARDVEAFLFTDELNVRYFAGGPLTDIWVCRNDFVLLILPTDPSREPVLLLNKARQGATRASWIKDQRFWMASIDAPTSNEALEMIVRAMREKGIGGGKICAEVGMSEKLAMPVVMFEEIRKRFPHMTVESANDHVTQVQAIKSAEEIGALRTACEISTIALEKGLSSLREGISEIQIANTIKSEMFRLGAGAVPFLTVVAGWEGRSICCDSHPTSYQLKRGDVVQIDGGCSYKGYCADMVRTGALGYVKNARYRELYEASRVAHADVRSQLRPRARIGEVCMAGKQSFIRQGYGDLLVFGVGQTGHGIGLDLHQAPFLLYDSADFLAEGMTLAIEPTISEKPDWDESSFFTIVENNYLITASGFEKLTTSDEDIRIV
jgi:Xaa-Pro dipeptidase